MLSRDWSTATTAERLQESFRLFDVEEQRRRECLRQERPGICKTEEDREIARWLQDRPGAEFGDMEGVPAVGRMRRFGVEWPPPESDQGS